MGRIKEQNRLDARYLSIKQLSDVFFYLVTSYLQRICNTQRCYPLILCQQEQIQSKPCLQIKHPPVDVALQGHNICNDLDLHICSVSKAFLLYS